MENNSQANNDISNNSISKSQAEGIKIIEKLLKTMHKDIKSLMKCEVLAKGDIRIGKIVERINNIALSLQKSLDLKNGGEIAQNLDHLYKHIRFAVIRVWEDHDFSCLKSAEKVTATINEGWSKMSLAAA
tara:strand:- start:337 stop:726 length:390 start_codon:yes stop_codon:yes gene_type:complete